MTVIMDKRLRIELRQSNIGGVVFTVMMIHRITRHPTARTMTAMDTVGMGM